MGVELEQELKRLCTQAGTHVACWSSRTPVRTALYHLTRGRIGKRPRYGLNDLPRLDSPWQDTDSGRYFAWRCRQANLGGGQAFVVEYLVCPHCRIGWVDNPHTIERYQRSGLVNAARPARAAHRAETLAAGGGCSAAGVSQGTGQQRRTFASRPPPAADGGTVGFPRDPFGFLQVVIGR